ncbi:MAG: hypothetical protein V3U95_00910, partial [Dehalococcoidia bacterium]
MTQQGSVQPTTACPHCGALEQEISTRCQGCGRFIASAMPEWARGGRRQGVFGRQGLIFMTQNKWL